MPNDNTRMHGIHPAKLRLLQANIAGVREILGDNADEVLRRDTLEGETNVMEVLDHLLEEYVAAKHIADLAAARARKFKQRMERPREAILFLLEAADLRKVERPVATASLTLSPPGVHIPDPDQIPMNYLKIEPDVEMIKKALLIGQEVEGATLTNRRTVLRITPGAAVEEDNGTE